jgi:hypothetical protein
MDSLDTILPVVEQNKINDAFVKANLIVLQKHKTVFSACTGDSEKFSFLKKLWVEEFQAELIIEQNKVEAVKFQDSFSKTLFMLKYS